METIKNFFNRLFFREDGSVNKRTLTLAGIGAAAGAIIPQLGDKFNFLGASPIGAILVGGLGLAAGAVMEAFWPQNEAPQGENPEVVQADGVSRAPEGPEQEQVVVPRVPNVVENERGLG